MVDVGRQLRRGIAVDAEPRHVQIVRIFPLDGIAGGKHLRIETFAVVHAPVINDSRRTGGSEQADEGVRHPAVSGGHDPEAQLRIDGVQFRFQPPDNFVEFPHEPAGVNFHRIFLLQQWNPFRSRCFRWKVRMRRRKKPPCAIIVRNAGIGNGFNIEFQCTDGIFSAEFRKSEGVTESFFPDFIIDQGKSVAVRCAVFVHEGRQFPVFRPVGNTVSAVMFRIKINLEPQTVGGSPVRQIGNVCFIFHHIHPARLILLYFQFHRSETCLFHLREIQLFHFRSFMLSEEKAGISAENPFRTRHFFTADNRSRQQQCRTNSSHKQFHLHSSFLSVYAQLNRSARRVSIP